MTNSDPKENETDESPQIVVDSDWKEQVAKEKETLANQTETESDSDSVAETNEAAADSAGSKLPPASFEVLVSMLFTQGMSSLGQIPMPGQEEGRVDKPMAKHSIDTLEVLSEKTKGNLSDDESKMLTEATHALRMAYVSTRG
ncbi:DUF1844 domain-containing protein [Rhodopirellula europaea]|jgi:hypothetical protein|uniref:Protein containing DUF1844 n=1 Tax=Rhodopirellula europaea SH398 TaxID=1263868 RepID=M5SB43_9BACT|nr:DUF1844 domain-containing protein [Rhodopirellula europaea]EMI24897.1 protein containing DUF1844 [Rhodopirellula europaea SH398]|tara:strand:+ start:5493 stop:5921 length:429 start_codon:yes stop_codon:yes gene_type:complete